MANTIRILKGGKGESYLLIKQYKFKNEMSEFYGFMGKYFAEPKYKKEMPYMVNKEGMVWFVVMEEFSVGYEVIGFGSVNETKNKIIFESSYVEELHRKKNIWKKINEMRLEFAISKNKPVEVITQYEYLKDYWIKNGFEEYRKNGKYIYLRRDFK